MSEQGTGNRVVEDYVSRGVKPAPKWRERIKQLERDAQKTQSAAREAINVQSCEPDDLNNQATELSNAADGLNWIADEIRRTRDTGELRDSIEVVRTQAQQARGKADHIERFLVDLPDGSWTVGQVIAVVLGAAALLAIGITLGSTT